MHVFFYNYESKLLACLVILISTQYNYIVSINRTNLNRLELNLIVILFKIYFA